MQIAFLCLVGRHSKDYESPSLGIVEEEKGHFLPEYARGFQKPDICGNIPPKKGEIIMDVLLSQVI